MTSESDASVARLQDTAYQLARLRHRYTLVAGLAVVAVMVALGALALAVQLALQPQQRAGAFVVEDADGNAVARLGLSSEGQPALYLYDGENRNRMWFGLAASGQPQLMLADATGQARISLLLDDEHAGQARLYLRDEEGRDRLALGLADGGGPAAVFSDEEGQPLLALPSSAGATPEERWANYNAAGTRALVQGRLAEAERFYAAAVQEARALGAEDLRVAASLNNLGALYVKANRLEDADRVYQRSLQMRRKALGEHHPQLAQSLANIAFLRRAQDLPTEAEELYRQAIAMWERLDVRDDPRLAGTLAGFAELLEARGEEDEAQALRARAQAIQERAAAAEAGGG
ncbi:MAG: tetratricopeptide repeat protein [Gammaproteobacteria bacterium]|nr:tetratricopeptide repeat protein [Gammaproteobacteria bacterium]